MLILAALNEGPLYSWTGEHLAEVEQARAEFDRQAETVAIAAHTAAAAG